MKAIRILFVLLITLGSLGFFASDTQTQGMSYVSGLTIYNLSNNLANITLNFYQSSTGTSGAPVTNTINPLSKLDYVQVPVTSPFSGSMVISSDQPVAAMSNVTGTYNGVGARGAYVGSSKGGNTLLFPLVGRNWGSGGWSTWISVQNVSSTAATVTIDYNHASCPTTNDGQQTLNPGASYIFAQNSSCLPNASVATAVISSTQDVVATIAQESLGRGALLVSNAFSTTGTPIIYIPLVNSNNNLWRTVISVYNNSSSSSDVTFTYKRTDGTSCTETQTIQGNSRAEFAGETLISGNRAGVTTTCVPGVRMVGSAYVSANSNNTNLVATVNQDRSSLASAYTSFAAAQATNRVVMPLIMDANGSGDWATSFNVMNVGSATTYVRCTFAGSSYVATSDPTNGLGTLGVFEDLQRGKLGGVKVSSADCIAYTSNAYSATDAGAKIIAVVNERGMAGLQGDLMMSYEAINVTAP